MRRNDPDVKAADAARLLNDPVFQQVIVDEERRIVSNIANGVSDGSAEYEAQEREWCRELRTLTNIKRNIMLRPQAQTLRESTQSD